MRRANRKPLVVGVAEAATQNNPALVEAIQQRLKRREVYTFQHEGQTFHFNVSLAWHLLLVYPRSAEEFSPAEQGVGLEHLKQRYPDLDLEYAKTCDMTLPLVFVPFNGAHQLIDGWHRLARALLEEQEDGCAVAAAFILTDAEAALVRVRVSEGGAP